MKGFSEATKSWILEKFYEKNILNNIGKKVKYKNKTTGAEDIGVIIMPDEITTFNGNKPYITGLREIVYLIYDIDIMTVRLVTETEEILFKITNDL